MFGSEGGSHREIAQFVEFLVVPQEWRRRQEENQEGGRWGSVNRREEGAPIEQTHQETEDAGARIAAAGAGVEPEEDYHDRRSGGEAEEVQVGRYDEQNNRGGEAGVSEQGQKVQASGRGYQLNLI